MKKLSIVFALACAVASADAAQRLKIRVSYTPQAEVLVETFVERDAENRALEIILETEDVYRSTTIQLDGLNAPRFARISLGSMPPGMYEVTVQVLDKSRDTLARGRKYVRVV